MGIDRKDGFLRNAVWLHKLILVYISTLGTRTGVVGWGGILDKLTIRLV